MAVSDQIPPAVHQKILPGLGAVWLDPFPCSSTLGGNTAHSLLLNSSRAGRGRSHLREEAQSRRWRAGSRAAPARAGAAAAAGSRCARAGGSAEAGRLGGPGPGRRARSPPSPHSLPRTLARPPPAASHWLTRALRPAAAAAAGARAAGFPQPPRPRPLPARGAGAFLELWPDGEALGASQLRPPGRFFAVLPARGPAVRSACALALSPAPSPSMTRADPRCNFSLRPSWPHPRTGPQPRLAYPFLTSEIVHPDISLFLHFLSLC